MLIVAVVLPCPPVVGVPVNFTEKFAEFGVAVVFPDIVNVLDPIAAKPTATNTIAINNTPPTIIFLFPLICSPPFLPPILVF